MRKRENERKSAVIDLTDWNGGQMMRAIIYDAHSMNSHINGSCFATFRIIDTQTEFEISRNSYKCEQTNKQFCYFEHISFPSSNFRTFFFLLATFGFSNYYCYTLHWQMLFLDHEIRSILRCCIPGKCMPLICILPIIDRFASTHIFIDVVCVCVWKCVEHSETLEFGQKWS